MCSCMCAKCQLKIVNFIANLASLKPVIIISIRRFIKVMIEIYKFSYCFAKTVIKVIASCLINTFHGSR